MRFLAHECLNENVFDPVHHKVKVQVFIFKIVLQLCQVPLTGVFTRVALVLFIAFIMFVNTVVSQMDVLFIYGFGVVGIFLCGKPH
jgi:hypothetical protein